MKEARQKLSRVGLNILHSVADQGVSSGTNFALNVLLARWLTRSDYGAFSVAWSFCLILAALHNALILEPMSVVGPAEYGSKFRSYLAATARFNWIVLLGLGAVAALIGVFYTQPEVRHALFALCLFLPGYLLLLTRRRVEYVLNEPFNAFKMSLLYAAAVATALAVCRALSWMSALTGLVCVGMALPVAVWSGKNFSSAQSRDTSTDSTHVTDVVRAHWHYGCWLLASAILAAGIADIQTILLSVMVGLRAAGTLRAMLNFVLPLSQAATVLSVYALPHLARYMKSCGLAQALRHSIVFPAAILLLAFAYGAALLVFGPALERILYNGRMSQYNAYFPLLCCVAVLSAAGAGFSTVLRAAQNSQHQLLAGVIATVVGIAAALCLLRPYGVKGAIVSMILANAASAAWIIGTYLAMVRSRRASWAGALTGLLRPQHEPDALETATVPEPS